MHAASTPYSKAGLCLLGLLLFNASGLAAGAGDPASLDRLHDVIAPAPVRWWPLAPGWHVAIAVLSMVFLALLIRGLSRYRANAYRRAALAELDALAGRPDAPLQAAELLKRVALTAFPRAEVASLSGERWIAWLNQTADDVHFDDKLVRLITEAVYRPAPTVPGPTSESQDLLVAARQWIRQHRC
jgi:hypothetical protein